MFVIHSPRRGYHQTGYGWVRNILDATTYRNESEATAARAFCAPSAEVVGITEATAKACQEQARKDYNATA
jgi:hypothetical protein